ncbi:MAG: hypothetical protein A2525_03595 [Sulfurimonas sp. RIFOXYD12_FULL_36_11]|jgi:hypothetical protein|uniref:hypothetical protein n=1 Tax=Sulfurimonas sp. RIFOXYB12_FULL_35_9 TaxID=1802256 RepID=UPI0008D2AE63|nr:hypothetical protein [Sulfurimonas sp. RIFOXYB12_FULL_35_9]OHE03661.1 MAG: hypothetical protein A2345_04740 [Sulfurimonas sp. RIFOXYB12_FULL_35_9]OHE18930.1 MAG: hypothetical protein A2540_06900 [Sulfurimonas sp. RIFOXYD2_FULL_37_8]OHE19436.1 MAG: hypothetical protein A2525_03595 [Sulfurimonas sp. RIFOXYD12_FULL_36_11]
MNLKYAGPKPIISHRGIEFDNNKEDKYVYLNVAVQILKSLNHEYIKDKIYTYDIKTQRLSNDELLRELRVYCSNIDELINVQNHNVEDEIEHMVKRAHENMILSEEDKSILEKNIQIMHDYLIQRSVNKRAYYCVVDALANVIKKEKIDYIVVPMFQTFLHTLHSVQGSLIKLRQPILSDLDIYKENDKLFIKLKICNS